MSGGRRERRGVHNVHVYVATIDWENFAVKIISRSRPTNLIYTKKSWR